MGNRLEIKYPGPYNVYSKNVHSKTVDCGYNFEWDGSGDVGVEAGVSIACGAEAKHAWKVFRRGFKLKRFHVVPGAFVTRGGNGFDDENSGFYHKQGAAAALTKTGEFVEVYVKIYEYRLADAKNPMLNQRKRLLEEAMRRAYSAESTVHICSNRKK